jgi:hypothetical protein
MRWLASYKAAETLRPKSNGPLVVRLNLDAEEEAEPEVAYKSCAAGRLGGLGVNQLSTPSQYSPRARFAEDAQMLLPFNPLKRKGCNFSLAQAIMNSNQLEVTGSEPKDAK